MSENMKKKLAIFAAGTGGHVYPGISIANQLIAENIDIIWIGTKKGIEKKLVEKEKIHIDFIDFSGVRGKGLFIIMKLPLKLIRATYQAFKILKKTKPNAVLSMGGYVSVPCVIASKFLGLPILIHEQNIIFGLANKISKFFANSIITGFPMNLDSNKYKFLGNPTRYEKIEANKNFQVRKEINIAVIGGSLGAKIFNEIFPKTLFEVLKKTSLKINVIHQTGKTYKIAELQYKSFFADIDLREYIDNMGQVYDWCDIIICRGGAITLTEIMNLGIPAVVIPYPYAVDNHQMKNCIYLEENDSIILIDQKNLSENNLANIILKLTDNQDLLKTLSENLLKLNKKNATKEICNHIKTVLGIYNEK